MAKRKFIFRPVSGLTFSGVSTTGTAIPNLGKTELILPVTPDSFQVEKGVNVEVVNIHELGDAIMLGYGTLATITIHCMFPRKEYSFSRSKNAQGFIDKFEQWIEDKTRLRFIVGYTGVNIPVVMQSFSYGEQDGTNDVYADIILREYRDLKPLQVKAAADNKARAEAETSAETTSHTIQAGDTLSAICRKYYGDGSAGTYNKLAAFNNIANPHLIYAGNTLTIPQPLTGAAT